MPTAIVNQANIKLVTIDKSKSKYAVTLLMNWNGLPATNLTDLSLPVIATERLGFEDTFSLITVNQAASQGVGKIKQVTGIVSLFPQSVATITKPAGGLYLIGDSGQIIALEQKENCFNPPGQPQGLVDPGSITFSLPFELQSLNSRFKIVKLTDNATAGTPPMTGSATLTFLTYETDTYLR